MPAAKVTQLPIASALPAAPAIGAGLGLGALAFALFTVMDALVKWLSATYPVPELVFTNSLFALLPVLVVSLRRGGLARLRTRRLGLHVLRGLLGAGGGLLAFYAYSQLPLADAYAIIFTTPLIITALSLPVLGEPVGWRRWSAVGVGFIGVLIMLRPGVAPIGIGSLATFGAACLSALSILLVRKLGTTESTAGIALYSNLTVALAMLPLLPLGGVLPDRARPRPDGGGGPDRRRRAAGADRGLPARAGGAGRTLPVQPDGLGDPDRLRDLGRRAGGRQADRRGGGRRERPVHPLPRDRARPPPDRLPPPQRRAAAGTGLSNGG